jgi:hypothetical protein
VKKISAWAAILFAPTLVASVYGMNFDHMPELHWLVGYPFALALMGLASVTLYWSSSAAAGSEVGQSVRQLASDARPLNRQPTALSFP